MISSKALYNNQLEFFSVKSPSYKFYIYGSDPKAKPSFLEEVMFDLMHSVAKLREK